MSNQIKNKKIDVRSRYTQNLIKQSLVELLKTKNIKSITILELCKHANIARGTFYNQFSDIIDVYSAIEDDFIYEIEVQFENLHITALDQQFFLKLIELICSNSTIALIIGSEISESGFLKRIKSFIESKYIIPIVKNIKNPNFVSYLYDTFNFIISGAAGLLIPFLQKKVDYSKDELAKRLAHIVNIIIMDFMRYINYK